ncbi:MAG: hypothetical protein IPM07_30465 [Anaerolineales bacterium]|nr:hypothetical protein [Anaerolineales bacterium]
MLEKMARRLAQDALERVKPGTYTSVVDGVGLYQMLDGNYQVGERLGAGDEDTPGISFETAREAMVAMMAERAGALVVVPEEAPTGTHLAQIAQLLVDSGDVPTDASDVADGAAIVGTVKRALDWLTTARTNNRRLESVNISLSDSFENISAMLVKSPDIALGKDDLQTVEAVEGGVGRALRYLGEVRREAAELRVKVERLEVFAKNDADLAANRLQEASAENDRIREQYLAAQQEIGALTVKLEAAQRTNVSYSGQLEGWQGRYEGLSEALSMALDKLAEVRK